MMQMTLLPVTSLAVFVLMIWTNADAHASLDRPIVHAVNLKSVGTLGQALLRFEGEHL